MVKKHGKVKVFHFSGARIEDINQYIIPIIKKQPDYLIRHVGTNDATTNTSKKDCRRVAQHTKTKYSETSQ